MGVRPKFDRAEAAKLYAEGLTGREIGLKFGVSADAIFRALEIIGIKRRSRVFHLAKGQLGATHSHAARAANTKRIAAPSKPIVHDMGPAKPLLASPGWKCIYPLWPDGAKPTGEFCGRPREIGSYCAEHASQCYVRVRAS